MQSVPGLCCLPWNAIQVSTWRGVLPTAVIKAALIASHTVAWSKALSSGHRQVLQQCHTWRVAQWVGKGRCPGQIEPSTTWQDIR